MILKWRHSLIIAILIVVTIWLIFQFEIFTQCSEDSNILMAIEDSRLAAFHDMHSRTLEQLYAVQVVLERRHPDIASELIDSSLDLKLPTIYAIMPTHARPVQKAELTRQVNTFLNVPSFHWIVVEDSQNKTDLVRNLLKKSGLLYTHLCIPTPAEYKLGTSDPNWRKPRGVEQRNLGLDWLRQNLKDDASEGVVYFADDDNTYDLKLFREMRNTKRVSVWPVGLVGGLMVERPKVKDGHVVSWLTVWRPERSFAMDMAGFAINLRLLLKHPTARFSLISSRGYQESSLLESLVQLHELEPMAENCTKVLVWHTRTEKPNLKQEIKLIKAGKASNNNIEV